MIQITLKDGSVKEAEAGISAAQFAKSIGMAFTRLPVRPVSTAKPWTCGRGDFDFAVAYL